MTNSKMFFLLFFCSIFSQSAMFTSYQMDDCPNQPTETQSSLITNRSFNNQPGNLRPISPIFDLEDPEGIEPLTQSAILGRNINTPTTPLTPARIEIFYANLINKPKPK